MNVNRQSDRITQLPKVKATDTSIHKYNVYININTHLVYTLSMRNVTNTEL